MELLTLSTAAAGITAGACQLLAHHLMRGRSYPTPIPRYAVGSFIVFASFAVALVIDPRQDPIIALAYIYAASMVATWLGYDNDPAPARFEATPLDIEKWAAAIESEHRETERGD